MKKTLKNTFYFSLTFVIAIVISGSLGQGDFWGIKTAFGYGGGSSSGATTCSDVSYGDWGGCVNGFQYRDVVDTNPNFCNLTSSQQFERSRDCVTEEEVAEEVPAVVVETSAVNGEVLGEVKYAEGTLLRGSDEKVYVVVDGALKHITSLEELQKYAGVEIINVDDLNIEVKGEVKGDVKYAEGTLLRGSDEKVYVVVDGALKHITSLEELQKYAGVEIINVDDSVVTSFGEGVVKGDVKYADGTLLRGSDMKIYVIVNGKKKHILSSEELMKYVSQEILNVEDAVMNGIENA